MGEEKGERKSCLRTKHFFLYLHRSDNTREFQFCLGKKKKELKVTKNVAYEVKYAESAYRERGLTNTYLDT